MSLPSAHVCPGCGHPIASALSGEECLYCLLALAHGSWTDSDSSLVSGQPGGAFLQRGVLPKFRDYELHEEIARGGMGVVYRARQLRLNRDVAVKMILAGQLATPEAVQRFRTEAEAAAKLDHPGIVPIYEIGEHETQHFFSMKLIEGGSLAQRLDEFALPLSTTTAQAGPQQRVIAELMRSVARALEYAHHHGVLHRDLKPNNILIDRAGKPILTDFGLAKLTGDLSSGPTLTTAVLGSPSYMAPEQTLGRSEGVTTSADIYALGATLYQLLTRQVPFSGPTPLATMKSLVEDPLRRPRLIHPGIHPDLETIVLKCLEKDPAARYRSAADVADELTRFINGEPIHARPVSGLEQATRWCKRNPLVASLLGCLAMALTVGLCGVLWQWRRAESTNVELQASLDRSRWDGLIEMTNRNEYPEALAHLAKRLRHNPNDWRAAMLANSILDHQSFAHPRCPPITHGDQYEVTSATFNSNASRIATATTDGTARIWDARSGAELARLEHNDVVAKVTFSADDRLVLTASQDGTAAVWNADDGKRAALLPHRASVNDAVFLRSSDLVGTACDDGSLYIWDVPFGAGAGAAHKPLGVYAMEQPVIGLAVNATTQQLLVGGRNGSIVALDLQEPTGPKVYWTASVVGPLKHVDLSFDGKYAVALGKKVTVWEIATDEIVFVGASQFPLLPALSPNDHRLHTSINFRASEVIDLDRRARLGDAIWTKYRCLASAFSPRRNWLATGGWDYAVRVRDLKNETDAISSIYTHATPRALQFSRDGNSLLVVVGSQQFITNSPAEGAATLVWNLDEPLSQRFYRPVAGTTGWAAIDPTGRRIATNDLQGHGTVTLLDQHLNLIRHCEPTGERTGPSRVSRCARGIAFTPDGSRLLVGDGEGTVGCVSVDTGDLVWEPVRLGKVGYCYRLSHSGRLFAFATHGGDVHLIETSTGKVLDQVMHHGKELNDVNFSPDDRLLASAADDHTARIWDIRTGTQLQVVRHAYRVQACRFSPDGRRLVTGSHDFSARMWDVETGQPVGLPMKHQGEVTNASFSPDGSRILTSGRDATARLWDAETGMPLVPPLHHGSALREANFSPNGRLVVTVDHDCLQVWDTISGQPVGAKIRRRSGWGVGHDSCGGRVPFFPDSSAVFWGHTTATGQVIDTTIPPTPVPNWFPDMLECIGGVEIGESESAEALTVNEVLATRRAMQQSERRVVDDYQRRRAQWLSAEQQNRAIQARGAAR